MNKFLVIYHQWHGVLVALVSGDSEEDGIYKVKLMFSIDEQQVNIEIIAIEKLLEYSEEVKLLAAHIE